MARDMGRRRDLSTEPPFTYALFRVADERFYWYQGYHHIAIDGFSAQLVAARVAHLYTVLVEGGFDEGTPLGSFGDLVDADAAYRGSEAFEADRRFWLDALAGRREAASISGRDATGVARTFRRRFEHIAPANADRLRSAAGDLCTSLPGLFVAASALYVACATGQEDVTVGVPALGRGGGAQQGVPGMMSNVLPVRIAVRPAMPLQDLVDQSTVRVWEALRHQRYRYEDIRHDLKLSPGEALYSLSINIMPFDYKFSFAGCAATAYNVANGPFDDLSISVYDRSADDSLQVAFDADADRYTEESHRDELGRFQRILDWVATTPGDRPVGRAGLLSDAERHRILHAWNATERQVRPATFPGLFEAQVARTPGNVALVFEDTTLTYAELNARANRLARHLVERGVGPESRVAVAMNRSVDLVVALLAVLKAGGAYLPIDPDYPAERIAFMLADAAPMCLLSTTDTPVAGGEVSRVLVDDPALTAGYAEGDLSDAERRDQN
jgi:nonribosomal peptide synthetase DhbF